MQVPLDEDPRARKIRLHEMAHVRWTPTMHTPPPGVTWDTLNACEDGRIHKRIAERFGKQLMLSDPLFSTEDWRKWEGAFQDSRNDPTNPANPLPPREIARMIVASKRTSEHKQMVGLARRYGFGWVADIAEDLDRRYLKPRRPAFKSALEMGRELDRLFDESEQDEAESDLDAPLRDAMEVGRKDEEGEWGTLEITTPPLPLRMPSGLKVRVNRATDSGCIPRNWHRVPIDGRVFTHKRTRYGGGTVLIDQSGSMSLTPDDVLEILARYPGVLIAGYSGNGGKGELRVIGRNGRRAEDENIHTSRGGNVVDGPALDWLNEQGGPRVWISDGWVTGVSDQMHPNLVRDAMHKVRRGHIVRIPDIHTLLGRERT